MMSFGNYSKRKAEKSKKQASLSIRQERRYRRRYAQQQPNKATMTTEMGW